MISFICRTGQKLTCGDFVLFFGLKNRRPFLSQREGERELHQERAREADQSERESSTEL